MKKQADFLVRAAKIVQQLSLVGIDQASGGLQFNDHARGDQEVSPIHAHQAALLPDFK